MLEFTGVQSGTVYAMLRYIQQGHMTQKGQERMYRTILGLGVLGFTLWYGHNAVTQFAVTLAGHMARVP